MKILLCTPSEDYILKKKWESPWLRVEETMPPLGIYLLAAVARQQGHEAVIFDPCDYDRWFDRLVGIIADLNLVGVSANSFQWPRAREWVSRVKSLRPDLPVVLGGIHATFLDEYALTATLADYVVRQEGERTLPELLAVLETRGDPGKVAGLTYKSKGQIIRNPDRPALSVAELESLPGPAHDLTPEGVYEEVPMETSRGCLFRCVFCSIPFHGVWRGMSVGAVRSRLLDFMPHRNRFRSPRMYLSDDCFTTDSARLREMSLLLSSEEFSFRYDLEARITDVLKDDALESLCRIAPHCVQIGVECGYQKGLNRVRKGLTLPQIHAALARISRTSLRSAVFLSFIIGFPWEGVDEIQETIAFAANLCAQYDIKARINWLAVLPNSHLYRQASQYSITVSPALYDQPYWVDDLDFFAASHPFLDPTDIYLLLDFCRNYKLPNLFMSGIGSAGSVERST